MGNCGEDGMKGLICLPHSLLIFAFMFYVTESVHDLMIYLYV